MLKLISGFVPTGEARFRQRIARRMRLALLASTTMAVALFVSSGAAMANDPQLLSDIHGPTAGSNPANLTAVGGTLFFRADDGINGAELWKSDGTSAGTVMVRDINTSGSSNPTSLSNAGGVLYFSADNGTDGFEPWSYGPSGAGDPQPLGNINPSGDSNPFNFTNLGGTIVFAAGDATKHGAELWRTDGTPANTVLLKDINPGSVSSNPAWFNDGLGTLGGELLFAADDGSSGVELWATDGTPTGTVPVKDINPVGSSFPVGFTNFNGVSLFRVDDGGFGFELWKTDGTGVGTVLVKDINPSARAISGGTLFVVADDGATGFELWKSDGTAAGTVLVKDIYSGPTSGTTGVPLDVSGTLFLRANDGLNGFELWKSDGTSTGTVPVADINPGSGDSNPNNFVAIGTKLYFTADDGSGLGAQLWGLETVDNSASGETAVGDTVATNSTTTPADPVGTAVTTPVAGTVTIDEGTTTTGDPGSYSLLGQEVQITAPVASAADPLVLQFYLDASLLPPGVDETNLQVFRNGVAIVDCDAGAGTSATPDPCVAVRAATPDGGVALTVRTSEASTWNFGVKVGMTLSPADAVNEVGTSHTVTATIADAGGNPLAGVVARVSVSGSVSVQNSCATDASGQCSVTYQGPEFPGADQIAAYADRNGNGSQDPGEPIAVPVTKSWVLPNATAGQVTGGGQVLNAAGTDKIAFGFTAKSDSNGLKGRCNLVDPSTKTKLDCSDVTAVAVNGSHATIYGEGVINGQSTTYKVTVDDLGEPGAGSDTFTIHTASGYQAGGILKSGNVQVR